jgi:hypothetical protein
MGEIQQPCKSKTTAKTQDKLQTFARAFIHDGTVSISCQQPPQKRTPRVTQANSMTTTRTCGESPRPASRSWRSSNRPSKIPGSKQENQVAQKLGRDALKGKR